MDVLKEILLPDFWYFLKGMMAGLAVSLPLGPAAILCLSQSLHRGLWQGLFAGLGIAIADTLYGAIIIFGLTSMTDFLFNGFKRFQFLGGLILLILGTVVFISKPKKNKKNNGDNNLIHSFLATFSITLANPFILLFFAAVFTAIGVNDFTHKWDHMGFLIIGIFSGACLWWLCICNAVNFLQERATLNFLKWTNKFSGIIIITFALYTLYGKF